LLLKYTVTSPSELTFTGQALQRYADRAAVLDGAKGLLDKCARTASKTDGYPGRGATGCQS